MRYILFLLLLSSYQLGAQKATVTEYKKVFTTYPYSDPNPIPDKGGIYPYFRFDGFTNQSRQQEWKVVELENEFIKVMILPEIGGKIWAAIEKSTNQPFIYYNQVVKFRDVAMRGPWTSGGIEANYGIIGHTPNTSAPVDYLMKQQADGSASCFISWLDLLTRTRWTIDINLPADKAYFTTRSFWHNGTALTQPYYHWMNVGIETKGDLQFIYPGTRYIGHGGEYADWPVNKQNNKRIDFYEQNDFGSYKSYHVFGSNADFFGAYWHHDDLGMARYSLHDEKPGKKIWIWGLSQQGMIWEKLLTDNDGQYAEIQSGRLFNQNAPESSRTPFKHLGFEPYATDEWTEYWYPVLRTKGFVSANQLGAINYRKEEGQVKINFSPTAAIHQTLVLKADDKNIYEKKLNLRPLQVFADSFAFAGDDGNISIYLNDALLYQTKPGVNDLSRPVDAPADFNWNSAYGHYISGREWMAQRNYTAAAEALSRSLQMDSNFVPALNKMTELLYRNMQYEQALVLARRALSIDTHDGASNYLYGLVNDQLQQDVDAKDGYDIAALTPAFRAPTYTALAQWYLKKKQYDKAILYAGKALQFNTGNIASYKIKAIAERKSNRPAEAAKWLSAIENLDPLDHFASFEKYLLSGKEADKNNFRAGIRNELPYQTYLEEAIGYFNLGATNEAISVLDGAPAHPLISYWKAYLNTRSCKEASSLIAEGNNLPANFVLPFRSETGAMLEWLIRQTPDWKPKYYLALVYRDRNRLQESKALLEGIGNAPTDPFFYSMRSTLAADDAAKEKDLQRALQLNTNDWRSVKTLAEFYIAKSENAKALALAEAYYKKNAQNYIMGMLLAKTRILNGKYEQAGTLLSKLNIIPFEGATEGRQLYRQAMLMQAIQNMKKKSYKSALGFISKARLYPDNLGSGKPYDDLIDNRLEDYVAALVYQKTGNSAQAAKLFEVIAATPAEKASYKSNIIVQALALAQLGRAGEAKEMISKFVSTEKDKELAGWVEAMFNKESVAAVKDGNAEIIREATTL